MAGPVFSSGSTTSIDVTGQILAGDGSALLPSYSFSIDNTKGFFHSGVNSIGIAINGIQEMFFSTTGLVATNANSAFISSSVSSATSPSLVPDRSELGTGIGGTDNNMSLINVGVEIATITSVGIEIDDNLKLFVGTANDASFYYDGSDAQINPRETGGGNLILAAGSFAVANAAGPAIIGGASTTTAPTLVHDKSQTGTGIGGTGDNMSFIQTGTEIARITSTGLEMQDDALIQRDVNATITAFATGGQASATALTAEINEVSVVATTGDSVKLLTAVAGRQQTIVNNGANSMDVFPNTSDDLGAGVNTAVSLASGSNITYFAYNAVNWEIL